MFEALKRKAAKVKSLNQDKLLQEVLDNDILKAQIIDLNQKQLYEEGVMADGEETGEYAPATIYGTSRFAGKIEKGQPYDHVTLKDTGAFYDSMTVESLPEAMVVKAVFPGDVKREWPNALGLTTESKQEILPEIKESLIEKIKTAIA